MEIYKSKLNLKQSNNIFVKKSVKYLQHNSYNTLIQNSFSVIHETEKCDTGKQKYGRIRKSHTTVKLEKY